MDAVSGDNVTHDAESDAGPEPDPIADIAERFGAQHGCPDPRTCKECREAASLVWRSSPGHREAWYGEQQRKLADAIVDVCWRATPYGETEDGDIYAYIVTKGAMHRLIGAAQSNGISAGVPKRHSARTGARPGVGGGDVSGLAAVLAEHRPRIVTGTRLVICKCRDRSDRSARVSLARHEAHVEAAVLAWLGTALQAPAVAESLFHALDVKHDTAYHVHAAECCWSFPGAIDALRDALAAAVEALTTPETP